MAPYPKISEFIQFFFIKNNSFREHFFHYSNFFLNYRISSYSFLGNYSFLKVENVEIFMYSLSAFKWHKSSIKNLWVKSSEIELIFWPAFYLIIWLIASPKNFEKIAILKIWQLVFFGGVKIYFGELLLKWCISNHGKNWFSHIMPLNSYYFHWT